MRYLVGGQDSSLWDIRQNAKGIHRQSHAGRGKEGEASDKKYCIHGRSEAQICSACNELSKLRSRLAASEAELEKAREELTEIRGHLDHLAQTENFENTSLRAKLSEMEALVGEKDKALKASRRAIEVAITDEDGLDGGDGEVHLKVIDYALSLTPAPLPPEKIDYSDIRQVIKPIAPLPCPECERKDKALEKGLKRLEQYMMIIPTKGDIQIIQEMVAALSPSRPESRPEEKI